ncbi:MAG: hypothetical protein HY705_04270 [Gemmatimonadetes bacterium]|nr:hypothetical protein [Gemmatimonadota bacterium]
MRFPPLLALTLLAACAGGSDSPSAGTAGGTLVIVVPGDGDVLLPPVTTTATGALVSDRIFPRLAELTLALNTVDDAGYTPVLARRWEHLDATTLLFRLDPRARWQDGRPVTADDVVFTFEVYRDTLVNSPLRPNLEGIAAVTREDSLTVAFHFRRAYPEQLYDATYHLRVLPKHLLDSIPRGRLASSPFGRHPVGSGPFRFVRWRPNSDIVLAADSGYFLGRPRLDRLIWRITPDIATAVSMLITGEADAMEVIPQREEIERALRAPALRLVPYPSPFLAGILFNLRGPRGAGAHPVFGDRDTRRAVAMAVDRATIVSSVFGQYGEVPIGAASPMQWIAERGAGQLPYDPVRAARTLEERGWRDADGDGLRERGGVPLRFTLLVPTTSRPRQRAAVLAQAQLRTVGVDMRIQPVEFTLFERRSADGDFDALFFSRTLDPSPASLLQFWSSAGIGSNNAGGYGSPGFDSLVLAAIAAPSRAAASPLWRRALERLNDDAPAIFVYSPRNHAAMHRRFEHVTIRPDNWLATVAEWSVAAGLRLPRDRVGGDR